MYQAYMMTFLPTADRQRILDEIETYAEVVNWRAAVGAIFLAIDAGVSARLITDRIAKAVPGVTFVMAPVSGPECQGLADQHTWQFLNRPEPVTRRAAGQRTPKDRPDEAS